MLGSGEERERVRETQTKMEGGGKGKGRGTGRGSQVHHTGRGDAEGAREASPAVPFVSPGRWSSRPGAPYHPGRLLIFAPPLHQPAHRPLPIASQPPRESTYDMLFGH